MSWCLLLLKTFFWATTLSRRGQGGLNYNDSNMNPVETGNAQGNRTAFAARFTEKPDAEGFPPPSAWDHAPSFEFDRDWRGENPDQQRSTEVRLLWTADRLFIRFHCRYRTITVFPDARADGWRYNLWDRDVAEVFLQPDASDPLIYKEFEVSPNGHWIDLAVWHGEIEELFSGLHRRVAIDENARTWTAEMAVPMKRLARPFDPKHSWRVNFFRIEGQKEPRFYAAWNPTHSAKPDFHVPEAFGTLVFRD